MGRNRSLFCFVLYLNVKMHKTVSIIITVIFICFTLSVFLISFINPQNTELSIGHIPEMQSEAKEILFFSANIQFLAKNQDNVPFMFSIAAGLQPVPTALSQN